MVTVGSAKMIKNEYYLENSTEFIQAIKMVSDIAQLYLLKHTENKANAKYLIKLRQENQDILLSIYIEQQLFSRVSISLKEYPSYKHKQIVKLKLFDELKKLFPLREIQWGILRGVRPLKLVDKLLNNYLDEAVVVNLLQTQYALSKKKAQLAIEIAKRQNNLLADYGRQDIAVYIGIPYCNTKCSYCSFPSSLLPKQAENIEIFLQAIEQDIQNVLQLTNEYNLNVVCLYIGGGTPTSFSETHFNKFIDILKRYFPAETNFEFTFEAGRVDSLSKIKLQKLQELKVTRISLNPQTLNQNTLTKIGREHSLEEFYQWYKYVKNNYSNWQINMDLILGLPGESDFEIENTLKNIEKLDPDNITIHTLAFKKGAAIFTDVDDYYKHNKLEAMSENARECMLKMHQYPYYLYRQRYILGNLENIGYSKPGKECKYNALIMSEAFTVLGIGPSATTKVVSETMGMGTFFMPKSVDVYVEEIEVLMAKRAQLLKERYKNRSDD